MARRRKWHEGRKDNNDDRAIIMTTGQEGQEGRKKGQEGRKKGQEGRKKGQ